MKNEKKYELTLEDYCEINSKIKRKGHIKLSQSNNKTKKPVVMIAWDSAEHTLIEKWTKDGTLSNLKRLKRNGLYEKLGSTADWFAGSVWPAFSTGMPPEKNNVYNHIQWNPREMKTLKPSPDWLPVKPFWRDLSSRGIKICVVDVPFTYETEPVNGAELAGISTLENLSGPSYYPASLKSVITSKFSKPPSLLEPYGCVSYKTLIELRGKLLKTIEYIEDVTLELIKRVEADLIIANFPSTHLGGHRFWDLSCMKDALSETEKHEFENSLKSIYSRCDEALGRIQSAISNYSHLFVFSLHGMGPNTNRSQIIQEMVNKILGINTNNNSGILLQIRNSIPLTFRNKVKAMMPPNIQDFLTLFWRNKPQGEYGEVIPIEMDLQGFIRFNLINREKGGIINKSEYDDFCLKIIEGLYDFKNVEMGESVVQDILLAKDIYGEVPYDSYIPDIIVKWVQTPIDNASKFVSEKFGQVQWTTPGYTVDGRSGNHMPVGFMIVDGENINKSLKLTNPHILDLAPTIYNLFNIQQPANMTGKPLF